MRGVRNLICGAVVAIGLLCAQPAQPVDLVPQQFREVLDAIHDEFGDRRGDYAYPNGFVAVQVFEALIGNPTELDRTELTKPLGAGVSLMLGCRPHSCLHERAAIVYGPNRRLHAAAILHHHCRVRPENKWPNMTHRDMLRHQVCDEDRRMNLFLSRDLSNDLYRQALYEWARSMGYAGPVDVDYFDPP